MSQAELGRRTGIAPATINDIYHGRTSYYRSLVNEIADALHLKPFELLMAPADAMAFRNMQEYVLHTASVRTEYRPEDVAADVDLKRHKRRIQ